MMQSNPARTGQIHRAWAVCAACALMLAASIGLNVNIFSIYQPYIISLNQFTDTQGSLITTVRSLLSLVGMLTVDHLCAKLGLRRTVALGLGLLVLSRLPPPTAFPSTARGRCWPGWPTPGRG